MHKLIKVTGTFILGIGLLTGCATTATTSQDSTKSIIQEKKENNEKTFTLDNIEKISEKDSKNEVLENNTDYKVENNSEVKKQTEQSTKKSAETTKKDNVVAKTNNSNNVLKNGHNKAEAQKILDIVTYGHANMGSSTIGDLVQFNAIFGQEGEIKYVPMTKIVDMLNTYNKEIYNAEGALAMLRGQNKFNFVEVDKSFKAYNNHEKESMLGEKKTIVYSKKDRTFAVRVNSGIGSAFNSMLDAPQEDWQIEGDTITVNYVNVVTNRKTVVVKLKLNNKNYTGGANKSMYYVESCVFV